MDKLFPHIIILSFIALALFYPQKATASGEIKGIIGAIVDNTSRVGKEARVAIEMAIDDFNSKNPNQSLILHIRNSQSEPVQTALTARDVIDRQQVNVIMGPHAWEEVSLVAEVGSQAHIPTVSLADSSPQWARQRWPFLVEASRKPNQYAQAKAVAAVVQSWGWHMVSVIYEDTDSVSNGLIPNLSDTLGEIGVEISHLVALPPFASSSSLSEELKRLKREQCRVFVVHASLELATRLFHNAKRMEMMEKDYVWITTNTITDLVHSINASSISSMQGILGIGSYFPRTMPQFHKFIQTFCKKFRIEHPEEENNEPGISAVQAYDAARMVALALNKSKMGGQHLLEKISRTDFNGLIGKFQFTDRKLSDANVFQIVNVLGNGIGELGFWSDGLGFSKGIDERTTYNASMQNLSQVIWPGQQLDTPRGWTIPTSAKPLKVGVPTGSSFKQFVDVVYDQEANTSSCIGFSIEIFRETIKRLPYDFPYELIPFNGTYDALVEGVYLKKFDAVAGDVAIVGRRYKHAEFTHPYSETGLVMIVPVQSQLCHAEWLFMKPFTKSMWALIVAINVYNGFVVWLIERNHCPELKGSALNQIGTLLWLAFTTLFSLHGEKLHSNLSRMAMVVWLFVALVITQSYTASLTSMITIQRLEPTVADIETLKNNNAIVGYCRGSFVARYLEDVLGFKSNNIKNFTSPEEYARALGSGEIMAAFLEVPFAKLFLAKYCKRFIVAGPTYKVGGFGFAFPKGSPMLLDINVALLNVSESGKLLELENSMIGSEKCVDVESNYIDNVSLTLTSFRGLFVLTGGTSTVALVIYVVVSLWKLKNSMLGHKSILVMIFAVLKHWRHQTRRYSSRVSDSESTQNSSSASNPMTQV